MPRASGLGFRTPRLTVPDGQVDETSTIPHQFAHLKQIGSLPGAACPAQPSRPPEPARRRNVARTCDGERSLRSGFARLVVMGTPRRGAPWICPRPASMRACFLFLGGEKLSGAEGIPRVRHSETRDRDARASRLEPNVTPGRCSLLTRLVPVLRQADGQCEHRPGAGSFRQRPESRQTISYHSGVRTAAAPLPAFGVRARTVGDFFRGGQFIGKAAAGVPGKTSNEEI